MTIDDSFIPNKRNRHTPGTLPSDISIDSIKTDSTFTNPYEYPQVILLPSNDPDTNHITMREKPSHITDKRGHCSRQHD